MDVGCWFLVVGSWLLVLVLVLVFVFILTLVRVLGFVLAAFVLVVVDVVAVVVVVSVVVVEKIEIKHPVDNVKTAKELSGKVLGNSPLRIVTLNFATSHSNNMFWEAGEKH